MALIDSSTCRALPNSLKRAKMNGIASGKVVIDHLDALEPVAPRLVNEFVLPSLAFEIGLNLRLSGLPNIDHRLALQHGRERRPAVGRLGLTIESVGLRLGLALHVAKPCIEHSEDPTVHIRP